MDNSDRFESVKIQLCGTNNL